MPDISDEGGALALTFQLEDHVAGRVSGCRINLNKIIEPVGPAVNEVGPAVFKDRDHAFAEGAELRWPFLRMGTVLGELVDVRLGEDVARVGKGRHPFSVLLLRVPAHMIVV